MKVLNEMPTEGQFIAVITADDKLWSDTLKIQSGTLYKLKSHIWTRISQDIYTESKSVKYLVSD